MQIKPVTKADKPEYPTASEIDIPKVLNASKPNKWKRNAAIGAVMMGMMFGINGCNKVINESDNSLNKAKIDSLLAWSKKERHCTGLLTGIIQISHRDLLESEARETILQEFNKNNMIMDTTISNQKSYKIMIQRNMPMNPLGEDYPFRAKIDNYRYYLRNLKPGEPVIPANFYFANVATDAIDLRDKIALIYLTDEDRELLADTLLYDAFLYGRKKKISQKNNILLNLRNVLFTFAVFYHPSVIPSTESEKLHIEYAKDSLRAQVQDFIKWYKENKGKK